MSSSTSLVASTNSLESLERVIREVCAADVEPDGMVFDPATVKIEHIKEDAAYEGRARALRRPARQGARPPRSRHRAHSLVEQEDI